MEHPNSSIGCPVWTRTIIQSDSIQMKSIEEAVAEGQGGNLRVIFLIK